MRNIPKAPNASGYGDAGASWQKRALKAFIARSLSASEDIDIHNKTLRQRGRMLYMASPVAASAISTNRTKIAGSGLHMKSTVDRDVLGLSEDAAKEWQRNVEAEWALWADRKNNCDAMGMNNFYSLQQLAIMSWLMSGDAFVLMKRSEPTPYNPYSLRLHVIEADRICTPDKYKSNSVALPTEGVNPENKNHIYDGVEVDGSGNVVAYHICNVYPNQIRFKTAEWQRVEACGKKTGIPNILQIMNSERPDQYRGVTYLAPCIESLLQLRRYTESELMAALVQSFLTAWIITGTDHTEMPFGEVGASDVEGGVGGQPKEISHNPNEYEMGPGEVIHLAPDEDVKFGNPNIPTAGFDNFVKAICRMVGAALEQPYDVLLKEFNSSYSASKGALEEAWEAIKMRRSWFVDDFCQPVYESWLAEAVAIGRIKAPGFFDNPLIRAAWCGTRWDGPAQTHLDPLKEAKANEILVAHGWKTNEQITREAYGGDWEKNADILSFERKKLTPEMTKSRTEQADDEDMEETDNA